MSPIRGRIKKFWNFHTMECYTVIKKEKENMYSLEKMTMVYRMKRKLYNIMYNI